MACRSRTGEQYLPPSCSLGFPLGTERKRSSPTMLRRERSNVHSCWAHFLSDGRRLPPPATDRTSSSRWLAFLHPVALKSCINIKIELSETITLEFFFFLYSQRTPSILVSKHCSKFILFLRNFKRLKN